MDVQTEVTESCLISLSTTDEQRAERARMRRAVYLVLLVLVAMLMSSRLVNVRSRPGRTPMLSANDRSRWATVRALVEQGRYELDDVIFVGPDKKRSVEWYTIDLVRHRGWDDREHYYSSKPPLLATLVAALYWPLHHVGGMTMRYDSMLVIRLLIFVVQILPLIAAMWLLSRWAEKYGRTQWGRLAWFAAVTFGTFLTTFAITLNNHLPAAISTFVATFAALRIAHGERRSPMEFILAGFFAAMAAACELPALSFATLLTALLLWRWPRSTLLYFIPAAGVVVAAFFITNYLAHGTLRPAYSSRSDGPLLAKLTAPPPAESNVDAQPLSEKLVSGLRTAGIELSDEAVLQVRPRGNGWQIWDPQRAVRYAAHWSGDQLEVREWGNWYEYEGSYWLPGKRRGIDRGEPSRAVYAAHVLIGHHGVFSLTPLWLLSLWGAWRWVRNGHDVLRVTALAIVLITVVCFAFYLSRPLIDRNYGGMTSGFRWSFWMIPLWLLLLIPALDDLATSRLGRALVLVLLAISVFSAHYASLNPWTHPWLYDWWAWQGWLK